MWTVDAFAVKLGYARELGASLIKLQIQNLSSMDADWFYSSFHHSHPILTERLKAIDFQKEYGQNAVRTLFLLNGGAILALLTLLGALYGKGDPAAAQLARELSRGLLPAFPWFVVGLATGFVKDLGALRFWERDLSA